MAVEVKVQEVNHLLLNQPEGLLLVVKLILPVLLEMLGFKTVMGLMVHLVH